MAVDYLLVNNLTLFFLGGFSYSACNRDILICKGAFYLDVAKPSTKCLIFSLDVLGNFSKGLIFYGVFTPGADSSEN
jgi:hypothetical protein